MSNINKNTSTRDVVIIELKLVSSTGKTVDLMPDKYNAINIYEDIFENTITGTIQINDGVSLLTTLSIHGNEYLYITFGRPGETTLAERYTKVFRVYKISNREKAKTGQIQTYVLHFCSEELIFSNQQSISRSFSGGNCSEYVGNLCLFDLKVSPKRIIDFERSSGPSEFTMTRKTPLEAIQYLAEHSYSSSQSPFVFFENKHGFNFLSLQALYAREPIATIQYNSAKFISERSESPFLSSTDVNNFKFNKCFDVKAATEQGLYSSKLFTLDLIRQKYTKHDISLLNVINTDAMVDGYFPFNDATNRNNKALYEEFDSSVNFWLTNQGRRNTPYFVSKRQESYESFVENTLVQRRMLIELINNTELHCIVPANPQYTAGYTVNFNLPAFTKNLENERINDPYYSGKYLITAVRHVIVPGSMQTMLELSKNSVSSPLDLAVGAEYKKAQKI